jgi:hypothetical protein
MLPNGNIPERFRLSKKPGAPGVTTLKNAIRRNQPQERAGRSPSKGGQPHQAKRGHAARRAAPETMFFSAPKITHRVFKILRMTSVLGAWIARYSE